MTERCEKCGRELVDFYGDDDFVGETGPVRMCLHSCESEPASKCPDALTPDGPICPRCGQQRGPSGADGGSWVHIDRTNARTSENKPGKPWWTEEEAQPQPRVVEVETDYAQMARRRLMDERDDLARRLYENERSAEKVALALYKEARDWRERFENSEKARAHLSMWQCPFLDGQTGLVNDEFDRQWCAMEIRVLELEEQLAAFISVAKSYDEIDSTVAQAKFGMELQSVLFDALKLSKDEGGE